MIFIENSPNDLKKLFLKIILKNNFKKTIRVAAIVRVKLHHRNEPNLGFLS